MKIGRSFKLIIVFFLLLLAWIFLAPFLAENLIVEKPLQTADAILILGGSSTYIERTQKAAEIFKAGRAPKIILTDDGLQGGWDSQEQRNLFFVERARRELVNQGVPESAIQVLPQVVEGTHDEAVLLEKDARERNLKSVLLVTSGYHTRRALWTFEKVLRDKNSAVEIGIESPPAGFQTPTPGFWWLSAHGWKYVAGEYLKIGYYWLFY